MPILKLLTDISVNDGWNLAALAFYAALAALIVTAIIERKKP